TRHQVRLRSRRAFESRSHVRQYLDKRVQHSGTMQTNFSEAQLADLEIAHADRILRRCVHCGLCTATCPTYVILGDERDSPRGRIYAIKDMLEKGIDSRPEISTHIDRCLSCFSCMTTCPSGVDYMHLVEIARGHIEKTG